MRMTTASSPSNGHRYPGPPDDVRLSRSPSDQGEADDRMEIHLSAFASEIPDPASAFGGEPPRHQDSRPSIEQSTTYIAHEMRQPLFAVLLNAEAALQWLDRDPPNFDEAKKSIEGIVGNGRRAADVARQVRDLLRNASTAVQSVDINAIIADSLNLTNAIVDRHGVSVEVSLGEGVAAIQGNRVQLEGVVVNLITNAVEAMSGVEGRERRLRISSRLAERDHVLVTVEDCGTGIGPDYAARIFDPYFTTKPEGTGLGLSICRSIVEAHGGRLWAAANHPHGSIFSFAIPAIGHQLLSMV